MEQKQTSPGKHLFRKQALDRISSPEELDRYLTVTGPGVWLPLIAVVVLLIGSLVWMIFGRIQLTINVAVQSANGTVVCFVPDEQKTNALSAGQIRIGEQSYPLQDAGYAGLLVNEEMDINVRRAGALEMGTSVMPVAVEASLADGIYNGEITVESVHPIRYIIN